MAHVDRVQGSGFQVDITTVMQDQLEEMENEMEIRMRLHRD